MKSHQEGVPKTAGGIPAFPFLVSGFRFRVGGLTDKGDGGAARTRTTWITCVISPSESARPTWDSRSVNNFVF